jgi:hypothetical protein
VVQTIVLRAVENMKSNVVTLAGWGGGGGILGQIGGLYRGEKRDE